MKNFTLLAFALFYSFASFAQNYEPFNENVPKRFFDSSSPDSDDYFFYAYKVKEVGEAIKYYQYFRLTDQEILVGEECIGWGEYGKAGDTTWLGREILFDSTAQTLLVNNAVGDELIFDFSLDLGDSSLFYANATDEYYLKYTHQEVESIYGNDDMVKTFVILHYNLAGGVVTSDLHLFEIKVGKTLGLLRFINCRDFPEAEIGLHLKGQLHPTIGSYQMTYDDVFPWESGDVLQYKSLYRDNSSDISNFTYKTITITDRVETDDSVHIYHSNNSFSVFHPVAPENTMLTNFDYPNPISFAKGQNVVEQPMDAMPYENELVKIDSSEFCGMRERLRKLPDWSSYCDSCECYMPYDGFDIMLYPKTYHTGLGITNTSSLFYGSPDVSIQKGSRLIYSKIGGVECGDQAFANVSENAIAYVLYPNPATDQLTIQLNTPIDQLRIVQPNGQVVYQETVNNLQTAINVSHLPKGIYLIELISDQTRSFGRFVKE